MLGFVVLGELVSTIALAIMVRRREREFAPALVTFLCIVAAQVLFWTLTFPANQETANWTVAPDHWMVLRSHWEYSHAAAAVLNLVAFVALLLSVLSSANNTRDGNLSQPSVVVGG